MKKLPMMILGGIFAAVMPIMADEWTDPGTDYTWTYRLNGNGVEIYSGSSSADTAVSPKPLGDMEIPSLIDDKSVTSIGPFAFANCYGLTGVTIPSSVTNIASDAFFGCRQIQSFSVANDNLYYKAEAGLLLTKDGNSLVCGINGDVAVPDGVIRIMPFAFVWRSGLTSVIIPNSVRSIDAYSFAFCSGLRNVTISTNLTSIGGYTFYACGGLTDVLLPDSLKSIGSFAFSNCRGLTGMIIPDSVMVVGGSVFANCTCLTNVTMGSGMKTIAGNSFSNCCALTSVTIPDSVTNIKNQVFCNCTELTTATIGNGVRHIEDKAFLNCSNLVEVRFLGDAPEVSNTIYDGTPNSLTNFVKKGSIGWSG
ncbi:MAG: leucine-rich repeat domain-containing protein, partial [Kiritimatiellae bacterium]|nr:leucine-rich repeat domain-containing protein [Kiritimatiellia bacterium]